MNSPQENKPASPPSAPKPQDTSPREMIEQAMAAVIMEMMQLRRTLWLVLKQTGPLEVDESQCHPLWRMKATRLEGGKARLEAAQLPEPTKEQIAALAEQLNGTMTPLEQAMERTDLRDHPPAYLHMLLLPHVTQNADGYWVDSALARVAKQAPPGRNN